SFFLAPHTIRGEVRFQGIELVGEVLDFVVEQTPHGNHAGQLAVAIDDGQMTDMFFEHELERFIGGGIALNGFDPGRHDVLNEYSFGTLPFRDNAKHQVAFAEHSNEAIVLHDGDSSDAFFGHYAHRMHNGRVRADSHKWRTSNSQ